MFMNFHSFLVKYNGVWTHSPHSSWVFPLKHLFPVYLRGQNTHIKTRKSWNVSFFFLQEHRIHSWGQECKEHPNPICPTGDLRAMVKEVLTCFCPHLQQCLQTPAAGQREANTGKDRWCFTVQARRLLPLSFYGLAGVFIVNHFQMEIYFITISG